MVSRPCVLCAHMRRVFDGKLVARRLWRLCSTYTNRRYKRHGTLSHRCREWWCVFKVFMSGFCLIFFVRPVFIDFHITQQTTTNNNNNNNDNNKLYTGHERARESILSECTFVCLFRSHIIILHAPMAKCLSRFLLHHQQYNIIIIYYNIQ